MTTSSNGLIPENIVLSTEPLVQIETWVRARLLEMMLSDPSCYVPDIDVELQQQLDLVILVAKSRNEPLADAIYAAVWAVGLVRREGIQLSHVFERRVHDLVALILASTKEAEAEAEVAPAPVKKNIKKTNKIT